MLSIELVLSIVGGQRQKWASVETGQGQNRGLDTEVVMRLVDWSQILEVCEF